MRAEIEKIVGAAALDEREVRDHWPLGLMEERDGVQRPKVLVARPAGRERRAYSACTCTVSGGLRASPVNAIQRAMPTCKAGPTP